MNTMIDSLAVIIRLRTRVSDRFDKLSVTVTVTVDHDCDLSSTRHETYPFRMA